DAAARELGAEPRDLLRREYRLAPLVGRLGEQLDGGRTDLPAACGCRGHAAQRGHVSAQEIVVQASQPHSPSVQASREITATNRTPPASRSPSPAAVRR